MKKVATSVKAKGVPGEEERRPGGLFGEGGEGTANLPWVLKLKNLGE